MKYFLKYTIIIAIAITSIMLAGCTRERPELPTGATSTATSAPVTLDGTPTVLAVGATATPAPVLGTPTPFKVPAASATPINAVGSNTNLLPTATPTALTAVAATPTTGGSEVIHVVQPGENLFRIGLKYGFTASELASYNNIVNPTLIYVGQKIRIPGNGTSVPGGGGTTYVVQAGDTLYTIAVRFSTSVQSLMSANDITNPNTIYIGQTIIVP